MSIRRRKQCCCAQVRPRGAANCMIDDVPSAMTLAEVHVLEQGLSQNGNGPGSWHFSCRCPHPCPCPCPCSSGFLIFFRKSCLHPRGCPSGRCHWSWFAAPHPSTQLPSVHASHTSCKSRPCASRPRADVPDTFPVSLRQRPSVTAGNKSGLFQLS